MNPTPRTRARPRVLDVVPGTEAPAERDMSHETSPSTRATATAAATERRPRVYGTPPWTATVNGKSSPKPVSKMNVPHLVSSPALVCTHLGALPGWCEASDRPLAAAARSTRSACSRAARPAASSAPAHRSNRPTTGSPAAVRRGTGPRAAAHRWPPRALQPHGRSRETGADRGSISAGFRARSRQVMMRSANDATGSTPTPAAGSAGRARALRRAPRQSGTGSIQPTRRPGSAFRGTTPGGRRPMASGSMPAAPPAGPRRS